MDEIEPRRPVWGSATVEVTARPGNRPFARTAGLARDLGRGVASEIRRSQRSIRPRSAGAPRRGEGDAVANSYRNRWLSRKYRFYTKLQSRRHIRTADLCQARLAAPRAGRGQRMFFGGGWVFSN